MAVVNHDIRFLGFVTDHPDTVESRLLDLFPRDSRSTISMPQHAEPEEGQCNALGKENLADGSRDLCKSIANAANDKVLEGSGVLVESRLLCFCREEAFFNERVR